MRDLRAAGEGTPRLLEANRLGFSDSVDIWYSLSMARRPLRIKPVMKVMFKAISRMARSTFMPDLIVAIKKT
jgi:hypothetical protein